MHYRDEAVEAHCYLDRQDDNRNAVYLTRHSLIICRSGKDHTYSRESILHLFFTRRTFLIPIVAGGIIAPLGIVAMVNHTANVWLLFTVIVTGLLIHYYGWVGSLSLVVKTAVKEYDVFIPHAYPHLKAFISYVNWQLRFADSHVYLKATAEEWEVWQKKGSVPEGTRIYFERPVKSAGSLYFMVNALSSPLRMSFTGSEENTATEAHLAGDFPLDYIEPQ